MPETYHDNCAKYTWSQWSDGNTNRNRTVTMNRNIALTAIFDNAPVTPTSWVLSPQNKTYITTAIPLQFTTDMPFFTATYSLDGQANVETPGNTTLTGLSEGTHSIVIQVENTPGNITATETVYFTVDTTPPTITDVSQTPVEVNGTFEEGVGVQATVTDAVSGVERVRLSYTDGNGTWVTNEMAKLEGDVWNGTIPAFPHGTTVTYTVIAEDNAGNIVTTEELYGQPNQYEVLPEFPLWVILPLFLIGTTSALAARKRLSIPAFAKIYNSLHKLLT
jgi:hypothetical protein